MARRVRPTRFSAILLWTIVLGLTLAAGAIFYKAFQQGTENRTKAALEGKVYYQWNFNKSASDFQSWQPYNLTLSFGKDKRSSRYLQGIVGEDRTNATLDQNFTDAKTMPVGIKKVTISMAIVPSGSVSTTHTVFMTYKAVETGSNKILAGSGEYIKLFLDGQYHDYSFDMDSLTSFAPTWIRFAWMELPPGSVVKINWIRVTGKPWPSTSVFPTPTDKDGCYTIQPNCKPGQLNCPKMPVQRICPSRTPTPTPSTCYWGMPPCPEGKACTQQMQWICPSSTSIPNPPRGCYYEEVQCIKAPCNPVLVCPE